MRQECPHESHKSRNYDEGGVGTGTALCVGEEGGSAHSQNTVEPKILSSFPPSSASVYCFEEKERREAKSMYMGAQFAFSIHFWAYNTIYFWGSFIGSAGVGIGSYYV